MRQADDRDAREVIWEMEKRKDRAFQQRIYLTEIIWPDQNANRATFGIMGNTNNVYLVKLDAETGITCSCPDCNIRGNFCKHCFFVILRVLGVPFDVFVRDVPELDETVRRFSVPDCVGPKLLTFLLNRHVSQDLRIGNDEERDRATQETMDLFYDEEHNDAQIPNRVPAKAKKNNKKQKVERAEVPRKCIDGECAICFEDMIEGKEDIVFCRYSCGQNLHQDCMLKWSDKKRDSDITCPYCRAKWF